MTESEEELDPLMKVKGESEKVGLKLNIQKTKIMASQSHDFTANRWGNNGNRQTLISWAPKSLWEVTEAKMLKDTCSLEEKPTRPHIKKQRHYFADKGPYSQSYGFSSSRVWMWELDHKEWWVLKNWCLWMVVLGNTLENPLNCKEIKPVNPKGNQSWIFIGRTDAEAEVPIPWLPDAKSQVIRKDWCWKG